jgi:phosphatidylglycerophosphate synthase
MAEPAASDFPHKLETWSRSNALGTLMALAASALVGAPWPLVAWSLFSFSLLLARSRGAFTPSGRFGTANALTCVRLAAMLGALLFLHHRALLFGAAALLVFALDGLDGWIARRTGSASRFGAHFDMETDAIFVLTLALELWQGSRLGAWILTSGVLRYAYVLAIALIPPNGGEVPRSRSGRHGFVVLVVGQIAALILPPPAGAVLAALATATVTLSFARSFYFSYGTPPPRGFRP